MAGDKLTDNLARLLGLLTLFGVAAKAKGPRGKSQPGVITNGSPGSRPFVTVATHDSRAARPGCSLLLQGFGEKGSVLNGQTCVSEYLYPAGS